MKYRAYRDGLQIGDYVFYENHYDRFFSYTQNSLIIDREFLFSQDTRWGERKFFEYTVYHNGKIEKIKTQSIRVKKISRSKKNENCNNRRAGFYC